jgi:hypothetical protein
MSEVSKRYYEKNKETLREQKRVYREKNRETLREKSRVYRKKNKENVREQKRVHREKNKETLREKARVYCQNRRKTDNLYKISENLRVRMRQAIKSGHGFKLGSSSELLGCDCETVKKHLEGQFTEGMTWDNHGTHGWHIDHILPCASFDLTDPKQQRECFHYTNLQPLWAKDNLEKGAKLPLDNNGSRV